MEDNLAAEIARIEAELEADRQLREQQNHQQQQQQHTHAFAAQSSAFSASNTSWMPQLQQQQTFSPQQSMPPQIKQQQQQQQQQQQHIGGGGAVSTQPHQFSKDSDSRSIFVGNLPKGENGGPTTTPEELAQFFADCGQILNCTVLRDRATGELKGTAYVEFAAYTAMGKAIDTKNNTTFKGSTIIVTKKRSAFRSDWSRGGRGRGSDAGDPYQAIMALMGMMGSAMMQRGGRGGGRGRSRGAASHPGGFQPFQ